ncbi:glutamine amidotransferase [Caballeronia sp. SEWSISQ10-4 2]|uniref:glutamine amidotransferase n=1 Tax=Caballeronia sp. SEWSISQ10-4 2 TaxID=2937438 RepID=UPI0026509B91|nr:glutamine amidotransferase [Caballeronia sp. SEWSISQ10-4 2]MDN7183955.1 glutamine amidotransferase [Caballeronia sp. SEWSISQ10-4 2]
MKHVLAIRHVVFEDLGTFERMFDEWGYRVEYVDAPTSDLSGIDVLEPDVLVVLGGPIGAYEQDNYPFLAPELSLIKQRLKSNRALLGICLGAQMIALACGARVFAGPTKEIGWAPVVLTDAGAQSALAPLAEGTAVLHWHGDTFDLPAGAVCLASTTAYTQQAFSIGTQVLGLQFHLEACATELESWLVGHAVELAHAGVSLQSLRANVPSTDIPRRVLQTWLASIVFD